VKISSRLSLLVSFLVLAFLAPVGAAARPPQHAASLASLPRFLAPPPMRAGAQLVVSGLASAPAGASAGHAYVLGGTVRNDGSAAARGRVVVRLLRVGSPPRAIGSTVVGLVAHHFGAYGVRIRLPRVLPGGSYALVACVHRAGGVGALGCATAERHLQIGPDASPPEVRVSADASNKNCSSGAHSLSSFGSHLYPETGNGGYASVHTDVFLDYHAATNLFLPGTHVVLTDRATQCLTDFSLDFERSSPNTKHGPDMTVDSVLVNGHPASFSFVQPTYSGDPNGQNDPDPRAHEASQLDPVGGPGNNPLPPACTPELMSTNPTKQDSLDGTQCPANKLVITPSSPIPSGTKFVVEVAYTGRPGVHNDGDGTTEGWFRDSQPGDRGSFVTTEPVASEDWMPLNDHPSAKPRYDFYDTVPLGKTAIANGELVSQTSNPPDGNFPGGSTTWHWHSPEGIASYLVEDSIGSFELSERLATSGIQYYEAQDSSIPKNQAAANQAIMNMQEDIVNFQSMFNGPFPFTTDGVVIGVPSASFEEEMQTKITFAGGTIDLQTFNHENMHQWWGDNVSEANYNLTFFKEGLATLGEYLFLARNAQTAAGGPGTPAGDAAFENSLVSSFDAAYADTGSLWTAAPSSPRPYTLFAGATTYTRPGIAYIALRRILGPANFGAALQQMQRTYQQGSITEAQLEAGFKAFLPNPTRACSAELRQFFTEWFDTVYSSGGGANRPQITAPGLDGGGFQCG
jgi:Peptidase family M1 domain